MVKLLDGRAYAQLLQQKLRDELYAVRTAVVPNLAVVLVGDDSPSQVYVKLKQKASEQVGIEFHRYNFSAAVATGDLMQAIHFLVEDEHIDAIVLQLPLPEALRSSTDIITSQINPTKDVDGFHPDNIRKFLAGEPKYLPPGLVEGMVRLIQLPGELLAGKHAVIVAKWPPFAETLAKALQNLGVDVEWIKPNALNLAEAARRGHILLTATGKANLITGNMVKSGAIVIDMGTNHVAGKLVGDVDYDSVAEVAGWLTPVPGGVGPMTVAMLLWRAYQLACQRRDLPLPEIPQITLADFTTSGFVSPSPAR